MRSYSATSYVTFLTPLEIAKVSRKPKGEFFNGITMSLCFCEHLFRVVFPMFLKTHEIKMGGRGNKVHMIWSIKLVFAYSEYLSEKESSILLYIFKKNLTLGQVIKRVPKGAGASQQCPWCGTPGVSSTLELTHWPHICTNEHTSLVEKPLQIPGHFQWRDSRFSAALLQMTRKQMRAAVSGYYFTLPGWASKHLLYKGNLIRMAASTQLADIYSPWEEPVH